MFTSLDFPRGSFVCFTGGGGKTTLMLSLARYLRERHPVIVTTTTKMGLEEVESPEVMVGDISDSGTEDRIAARGCAFLFHHIQGDRYHGFAPEIIEALHRRHPGCYLLVEADGARRKPLKGYAEYEPPLPGRFDSQIVVVGADALLQPMDGKTVARFEALQDFLHIREGDRLTPSRLATLLNSPDMYLRNSPFETQRFLCLNKADLMESENLAAWTDHLRSALKGYRGVVVTGRNMKESFLPL